ncbi:MAG: thioredoxin [Clostridia bacterium]|nr:thioredoxin [Clostridia bacterium]
MVTVLTEQNFEQEVLNEKGKVLVDFWASWCGPCKMLSPLIDEIADERSDVKVAKVNVDEQVALAMKYNVSAIPTVLLFENGELINKFVGYRDKASIEEFIG